MAPRRPLPMGSASTHCAAGLSYQSARSLDGSVAGVFENPKRFVRASVPRVVDDVLRNLRRVYLPMKPTFPAELTELMKLAQSLDCGGAGFYVDDPASRLLQRRCRKVGRHVASELPSLRHRKTESHRK